MRPVTIEFNQHDHWVTDDEVRTLEAVAAFVVQHEIEAPADSFELSVSLVSDRVMRDLHAQYFDDVSETDIITFPGDAPDDLGPFLGDLVICGEVAQVQADEARHTLFREIAFLLVHGLLHIAGWDDADSEQRTAMLRRQEDLIADYEDHYEVAL